MKKIINNKVYISSIKELMKEWDFEKNRGKDPTTFLIDSEEIVCWKCKKGHQWEEKIKERVKGSKCPGCSTRKVISGFNDLCAVAPELALEWNYKRNKNLNPKEIACCSNQKVWWNCSEGHEWEAVVSSRYYRQ